MGLTIYSLCWLLIIGGHKLINNQFIVTNGIVAFITYGNLAGLLLLGEKSLSSPLLLNKIFKIVVPVTYVQAFVGIAQAVYGFFVTGSFDKANGDFVEGTIHLALSPSLTFANPMYAVNMAFCLLFIAVFYFYTNKGLGALIIGSIAFILASVMHVVLFLFLAVGIALILFKRFQMKNALRSIVFAAIAIGIISAGAFLLRGNLGTTYGIVNNLVSGNVTRSRVILRVWNEMPQEYPAMPLIGLGPGQFSSRASLISTGLFFGGPENPRSLPLIPLKTAPPLREYLLDDWIRETKNPFQSSSSQPLFSWLSIYTEFGGISFIALPVLIGFVLLNARSRIKNSSSRIMAIGATTGLLFLFLLGFQENYWEIPQAMFVGILLTKILFINVPVAPELMKLKSVHPSGIYK